MVGEGSWWGPWIQLAVTLSDAQSDKVEGRQGSSLPGKGARREGTCTGHRTVCRFSRNVLLRALGLL